LHVSYPGLLIQGKDALKGEDRARTGGHEGLIIRL
jgi:hypothetical protein